MQQRFEVLEVFVCIAIIYLVMTSAWELVQMRIEAYYGKGYDTRVVEKHQLAKDAR
jgi:polar amino acid transport system permease protein